MTPITFDYAFATPHTLTLSRPSASQKVLTDTCESGITFSWTYGNLKKDYPLSWTTHPIDATLYMDVAIGGETATLEKWYRHQSGAPCLCAEGTKEGTHFTISAIAAKTGVVVKITVENQSRTTQTAHIQMAHTSGWVVSNKGWVDGINNNLLLAMNYGRADRVLALGYGADDYPMYGCDVGDTESLPPMNNSEMGVGTNSMKKITAFFQLQANEKKNGYFLIPYNKYFDDVEALKTLNLEKEMADALKEWEKLLARSVQFDIADPQLLFCYRSCLADLFVMREKIGKYMAITPGTREYRSASSGEALEAAVLLDTVGYTKEAADTYRICLEGQDPDGCWVSSTGWEHDMWGMSFFKANAVMEHYRLTRDRAFLEENYTRMYNSTMFNHRARQSTKNSAQLSARGLMPRGMGDCGMMSNGDFYGIFYPWNCLSVGADKKTLEAAMALGKTDDVQRLTDIVEEARADLLASISRNLIDYDTFVMMPSAADSSVSSMYGCMFSFFPANLVSADEPMIQGAVKFIEGKRISEGGLPMGTGWQQEGLWVAMALGSIARTYLRLGLYKQARKYLYPALNHATPLVTYCEERGCEKGSPIKTGDNQHLWTPLSMCQYMTEAFWYEDDKIHLCAGILPEWLLKGGRVGVHGLKTSCGTASLTLECRSDSFVFSLKTERPMEMDILLHIPVNDEEILDIVILANGKTEINRRIPR